MCCKFIVATMLQDNVVHHKFSRFRGPGQQKEDIKKHKLVGAQCAQDTPTVGTTPVKNCTIKEPPGLHYTSLHYHNLPTFLIV